MGAKANSLVDMDVEKVIRLLNKAYADEWLAFLQYWTASKVAKGVLRVEVEKELLEHALEEFAHAEKIADRILQLGGTILLSPEEIIKEANCSFLSPSECCCCKIVEQTITSERCAVSVYRRMMEETCGKDPVTYHIAMEILKDELDHEDDFERIREDMEMFEKRMRMELEKK